MPEHRMGIGHSFLQCESWFAVISIGLQCFQWHRVNGVPPDQGLDILQIWVGRVLSARAGPQKPLSAGSDGSQLPEALTVEDLVVYLSSRLGAGYGNLAM